MVPLATIYVAIFIVFLFWRDMAISRLSRAIRFGQGRYLAVALCFVWTSVIIFAILSVILVSQEGNSVPVGLVAIAVFSVLIIGAACIALFYYVQKLQKHLVQLTGGVASGDATHVSLTKLNSWIRVLAIAMETSIIYLLLLSLTISTYSPSVRITVQIGFEILKCFNCCIIIGSFGQTGRGRGVTRSRSNTKNGSWRSPQNSKREPIALRPGHGFSDVSPQTPESHDRTFLPLHERITVTQTQTPLQTPPDSGKPTPRTSVDARNSSSITSISERNGVVTQETEVNGRKEGVEVTLAPLQEQDEPDDIRS